MSLHRCLEKTWRRDPIHLNVVRSQYYDGGLHSFLSVSVDCRRVFRISWWRRALISFHSNPVRKGELLLLPILSLLILSDHVQGSSGQGWGRLELEHKPLDSRRSALSNSLMHWAEPGDPISFKPVPRRHSLLENGHRHSPGRPLQGSLLLGMIFFPYGFLAK